MLSVKTQHELLEQLSADRADYIRYLSRRVSSPADCEDIVQQAYGKAVAHIGQLRDATRMRGWFQGILRRAVADFYASRSRERRRQEAFELEPVAAQHLTVVPHPASGMCHCGEALLEELPEKTVELLWRVDIGDECPSEVAPDLGLTANSARVRLHRAHAKLRAELKDHCSVDGTSYRDFLDCECTGC